MTILKKQRPLRRLFQWLGLALCISQISPAIAQGTGQVEGEEQTRHIEVASMGFSIDVPTLWRLELDERANRFLTIKETNTQGQVTGVSLNAIRRVSSEHPLPQLPEDVDVYADLVVIRLTSEEREVTLVSAGAIELDGYQGVRIEAVLLENEISTSMTQIHLVHPKGKDAFIVSMGSLHEDRERAALLLDTIYQSMTLQVESD